MQSGEGSTVGGRSVQWQGAADKIGGFMEGVTATTPEPEPPEPTPNAPESTLENGCKIIPFAQAM